MPAAPYLFFDGNCAEALEFYAQALGAEVSVVMRFKESPDPAIVTPDNAEKVMHAGFTVGGSEFMASDDREGAPGAATVVMNLMYDDIDEARRVFDALAAGGAVKMPFKAEFFSPGFGRVDDKFGVPWMVYTNFPQG